jgi:O-antigen/teichoic acid export membrane protein
LRTARGIAALASGEVLGKVATLALIVIAARSLGEADYGVFAYALALGTLLAVFPSWGFDTTVIQEGSAAPDRLPRLLAELLAARTLIAVPLSAVAIGVELLRRGGDAGLASAMVLLACSLDTYSDAFRAVATAREAQGRSAAVLVLQRVVSALAVVAAIALGLGLVGVAAGFLSGSVVGALVMSRAVVRLGIRPDWRALTWRGIRRLVRTSHVAGVTGLASAALFRIDAVLLGLLAGDAAVGTYSAAYRLLETILFVTWAVSRAVFPVIASNPEAPRVRRGFERGFTLLTVIFLPYGVVLLLRGEELMALVFGAAFADDGAAVLRWLAFAPILFALGYLASYALMARGPDLRIVAGSVAALVVNIVLNLVLIPGFGAEGAAAATVVAYLVEGALIGFFMVRTWGWPLKLAPFAAPVLGSIAVAGVLLSPLPLIPALLVAGVAYAALWAAIVRILDPEQMRVVMGVARRRSGDGGADDTGIEPRPPARGSADDMPAPPEQEETGRVVR